jgi:SagB-type dehydrogenase family enzyme
MNKPDDSRSTVDRRLSRRRLLRDAAGVGVGLAALSLAACDEKQQAPRAQEASTGLAQETPPIALPVPRLRGEMPLEEAISDRRSRREFSSPPLTLEQVSQVLWAAQGITDAEGHRAAPSAGALYPLDLYLVVGRQGAEGLVEGAYYYVPQGHALERVLRGDVRDSLARIASEQMFVAEAPVILVVTGEYERTTRKYGDRGVRYVHMEAGHAAQNVYLQAEALGLGTVTVGAFQDEELSQVLALPAGYRPLYVMPVGHPAAA